MGRSMPSKGLRLIHASERTGDTQLIRFGLIATQPAVTQPGQCHLRCMIAAQSMHSPAGRS